MSSKKLFDQSVKLEKLWSHVFTATISLTQPEAWFRKIREIIDKQQSGPLWMSETKVHHQPEFFNFRGFLPVNLYCYRNLG